MTTQQSEKMILNTACIQCNTGKKLEVNKIDFEKWKQGELIQFAFPYLTPGEREILISGMCNECFDDCFA